METAAHGDESSTRERTPIMFLHKNASRIRLQEAEHARRNRLEILKALSTGQLTRRRIERTRARSSENENGLTR